MSARLSSVPGAAIVLVLIGIGSVQLGAGVAKTLFDEITPTQLVWLRLASSALLLLAIARPRLDARARSDWLPVLGLGLSLAVMNWAIYQSFARIPIGIAVTIEFIGPLVVAAVGFRRPRDLAWVGLAAVGVVLLGAERGGLDLLGVLAALLAGASWAAYILLTVGTGRRWEGLDGLAVASVVAVVVLSPAAVAAGPGELVDGRLIALGAMIGLLSSVIPYSCEMIALRRLPPSLFGVLMSLEPAAAALAGLLVLDERLALVQWVAIGCVIVASVGATRAAARAGRPTLAEPAPD